MRMSSLAAGLLVALGLAASADLAEAATFKIQGTFGDSTTFSGTYDFDGTTLSNVNIVTNYHTFTTADWYYNGDIYEMSSVEQNPTYSLFQFFFMQPLDVAQNIDAGTNSYTPDGINTSARSVTSGSIAPAATVVTPIPAALPLAASALASLGGLGWLKRRRPGAVIAAA